MIAFINLNQWKTNWPISWRQSRSIK